MKKDIICGNSAEVLDSLESETIDLVLTSPPYDNLREYNGFQFDFRSIAKQLYRVLKPGGVCVWVIGDATVKGSETGSSFRQALYFMECGFNLHDTMIYEKSGIPFPSSVRYNQSFEYMFVFSKGKPKTINLIRDKVNVMAGESRKNTRQRTKDGWAKSEGWSIAPFGIRSNIWRYKTGMNKSTKDKCAFEHPAIFPEELAKDHIISWSNEGDTILDPFNGSGTTTKLALQLNRQFIGIDVSEEYCKIAKVRTFMLPHFDNHVSLL